MMENRDNEIWVSTRDLLLSLKSKRVWILKMILLGSLLALLYALTRPISYQAEATFRDRGRGQSGFDSSAMAMALITQSPQESEAVSTFKSARVMAPVVQTLGLQVSYSPKKSPFPLWMRIPANLYIAWSFYWQKEEPLFSDPQLPLEFSDVIYLNETALSFPLTFVTDDEFEFLGQRGRLNEPNLHNSLAFTLKSDQMNLEGKTFKIHVRPFTPTVNNLVRSLRAELDKRDKSRVLLEMQSGDRLLGAKILNALMSAYHDYLAGESQRLNENQLAYLLVREGEAIAQLRQAMESHAEIMSGDLKEIGFVDSEKALNFFATHLEKLQTKSQVLELERRRLKAAVNQGTLDLNRLTLLSDFQPLLSRYMELKERRDHLALSLGRERIENKDPAFVSMRITKLKSLKRESEEITDILSKIDAGELSLQENDWTLDLGEQAGRGYRDHLTHTKELLDLKRLSLEEELVYQQAYPNSFDAIDTQMGQDLLMRTLASLNEVEVKEGQLKYLLEEMEQEEFEVTTLSSMLQDKVGQELLSKAMALEIAIRDPLNRSSKEQERMQEELNLQKLYLKTHIEQNVQLLALQNRLLNEKIAGIESALYAVVNRQLSLLEKQARGLVDRRLSAIEIEEELIGEELKDISRKMASYPQKWVSEQLLKQRVQLGQMTTAELAKLVENKNVTANLDLIQSAPIDYAKEPYLPKSPRLFLFALLGAFIGAFGSVALLLGKICIKGVPASEANLALAGQSVAGRLSHGSDQLPLNLLWQRDLKTLRNLTSQLAMSEGGSCLLAHGGRPSHASQIAHLLAKRKQRVLLIDLSREEGELGSYIKGDSKTFKVTKGSDFDLLGGGVLGRLSLELLDQERFHQLISELRQTYDWVLVALPHCITEAGVTAFATKFSKMAIYLEDETLQELQPFFSDKALFLFFN